MSAASDPPAFLAYCARVHAIVEQLNVQLEGNCVYKDGTLELEEKLAPKRENFVAAGRGCRKICEIGLNAGHSAYLLALGAGADLEHFLTFDLGKWAYVRPCLDAMVRDFPSSVRWEAVLGNSLIQAPLWIQQNPSHVGTFDVVHVDGGHSVECIVGDLATAVILTRPGGRILVDDLQSETIRDVLNIWLPSGVLSPDMDFKYTSYYPHIVLKKNC